MRIIAGKWRSRPIQSPPEEITRPTTDRVREALFSMLLSKLHSFEETYIVDAFAGSGALGLEALSRGANHILFAEKNAIARQVLHKNIVTLGAERNATVYNDCLTVALAQKPAHLIFLDPPYGQGLEFLCLKTLNQKNYIGNDTWIVLETDKKDIPSAIEGLQHNETRCFGRVAISFWKK